MMDIPDRVERAILAQAVFAALADPTRRTLLARLAAGSPATITHLADGLPMSRQAVTKHLEVLSDAGLVDARVVGREHRYALARGPLEVVTEWLAALHALWVEADVTAIPKTIIDPVEPAEVEPAAGQYSKRKTSTLHDFGYELG